LGESSKVNQPNSDWPGGGAWVVGMRVIRDEPRHRDDRIGKRRRWGCERRNEAISRTRRRNCDGDEQLRRKKRDQRKRLMSEPYAGEEPVAAHAR
jgi:hypothetical protein